MSAFDLEENSVESSGKRDYKTGGITWQLSHLQGELAKLEQAWGVLREMVDPVVDGLSPVPALSNENASPEPAANSGLASELLAVRNRVSDVLYQMNRLTGSLDF